MTTNPDRADQFRAEIESMNLKASGSQSESRLLIVGGLLCIVGVALAVVGGIQVTNNLEPANQRAYMATGSLLGIALLIAGAALFVRYSLARYLRFWLIRLVHESRANTDRVVEAIDRAAGTEPRELPELTARAVGAEGICGLSRALS